METTLFMFAGLPVTAYGACVAAAAALCVTAAYFSMRSLGKNVWEIFCVWCIPLAFAGARLFYVLARFNDVFDVYGPGFPLMPWEGGYALWGAVGGSALAGWITARRKGLKTRTVFDAAVPALVLMLALCRFSEYFSGQGIGLPVENEALWFFPLSVQNMYGEWYYAVFAAEGVTALLVCLFVRKRFVEHKAVVSLILLSSAQIVWESMRRDDFLRWGFVRVSQIIAVVVLLSLLAAGCIRRLRSGEKPAKTAGRAAAFLCLTCACVALEFAMDKTPLPYGWAWLMMAACAAGMAVLPIRAIQRKGEA